MNERGPTKETDHDPDHPTRIYVACLAAYNNGILHGAWIDANDGIDALWDAVRTMLKSSPIDAAEEFAIHDYEGFGETGIAEYESLDSVAAKAAFIDEHEAIGTQVLDYCSGDLADAAAMVERYAGDYENLEDFVRETLEEISTIPAHLEPYLDCAAIGRAMVSAGEIDTIDLSFDRVLVFWSH